MTTDSEVRVRYVALYPEGHEHAGAPIEREQECSRCGRKFQQVQIDRSWLNSVGARSEGGLEAYLKTCEVERVDSKRVVFSPARCPECTRKILNPQPTGP